MRTATLLLIAGALSLVGGRVAAHPQSPPSGQSSPNNSEQSIIVEGCIDGNRFRPDKTMANTDLIFSSLRVNELRLQGSEAVMKIVKQHDGHQDEISGVVKVPESVNTRVQTRQVGRRTRITGTASSPSPDPRRAPVGGRPSSRDASRADSIDDIEATQWLRMTVTSLRHLSDGCVSIRKNRDRP
jgi:hypothetical protein